MDKLTFDHESLITELKVLIRPASALQVVGARMAEELPRGRARYFRAERSARPDPLGVRCRPTLATLQPWRVAVIGAVAVLTLGWATAAAAAVTTTDPAGTVLL